MATLEELAGLPGSEGWDDLRHKVTVAAAIKAVAIAELVTPTAGQLAWARELLENPQAQADQIIHYVVAANESAAVAAILAADDATIQANVDAAVDKLLGV